MVQRSRVDNATTARRLDDLASQVAELTQLVHASFQLQLDLRRSIRQEVAAAMATTGSTTFDPAAPPIATETTPR
jgi:hypothetical protein